MKQRLMPQASYKPARLERHRTRISRFMDAHGCQVTAVVALFLILFFHKCALNLFLNDFKMKIQTGMSKFLLAITELGS
jgi:hypothetical protein